MIFSGKVSDVTARFLVVTKNFASNTTSDRLIISLFNTSFIPTARARTFRMLDVKLRAPIAIREDNVAHCAQ